MGTNYDTDTRDAAAFALRNTDPIHPDCGNPVSKHAFPGGGVFRCPPPLAGSLAHNRAAGQNQHYAEARRHIENAIDALDALDTNNAENISRDLRDIIGKIRDLQAKEADRARADVSRG